MKNFVWYMLGLLFLAGCFRGQESKYDKGYEAAWEEEELSFFSNEDEQNGYEDGLDDSWIYDEGYYDGFNGKKPKYPKDEFYLDGYKDGKETGNLHGK